MSRLERSRRRAEVHVVRDPNPSESVLPTLKAHAGQSVLLAVYRKGRAPRFAALPSGRDAGTRHALRHTYDVPATDREINSAFRGRHREGWFWDWRTGSDDPHAYHLRVGDEIRVFPAEHLQPVRRPQRLASGVCGCHAER